MLLLLELRVSLSFLVGIESFARSGSLHFGVFGVRIVDIVAMGSIILSSYYERNISFSLLCLFTT